MRSEGRDLRLVYFEADVVAYFVDAAGILGVPKSVAAIYGLCFANVEPLSFADVTSRLDISHGSISQGIRVLRDVGALKAVGTRNRREYFAPELSLRALADRFLEERLERQIANNRLHLAGMEKMLLGASHPAAAELQERLAYLESWNKKVHSLIPIAKAFLRLS